MLKKPINQETKTKILLSAKKIFAQKGFAGARMDAIARESGVNKAMLHYYFGSKDHLYHEVILHLVNLGQKGDFDMNIIHDGWTASQKLTAAIYCIVYMHFDALDDDFHRIIAWDFAEGKNSMKMLAKNYFAPGLARLEKIVVEGIQNGEFESKNPALSVWSFVIFIIAYINQQEIYKNTEIYSRLYGSNSKEMIMNFLLNHMFKSLSINKQKIPEIPSEVIQYFKTHVLDVKSNQENK
ncbi:MAG: TetR/AcrR family transcriptional regulator [Spirochaetia bacterium]|nr:TetR/AcrR family transcriptional regulator [Spirochaetia bacterium]